MSLSPTVMPMAVRTTAAAMMVMVVASTAIFSLHRSNLLLDNLVLLAVTPHY